MIKQPRALRSNCFVVKRRVNGETENSSFCSVGCILISDSFTLEDDASLLNFIVWVTYNGITKRWHNLPAPKSPITVCEELRLFVSAIVESVHMLWWTYRKVVQMERIQFTASTWFHCEKQKGVARNCTLLNKVPHHLCTSYAHSLFFYYIIERNPSGRTVIELIAESISLFVWFVCNPFFFWVTECLSVCVCAERQSLCGVCVCVCVKRERRRERKKKKKRKKNCC